MEGSVVGSRLFVTATLGRREGWIVGSVGSFIMGRAIHGVTVVDPRAALLREERAKKQ